MKSQQRAAAMGTTTATDISQHTARASASSLNRSSRWSTSHLCILFSLWLVIFVSALAGPPLLDDADATHAQAAQAMLSTGDWVTLHVNGIRYLEKAPLPYWIAALSLHLFGAHPAFAIHLPLALTVLGLALLGYTWSRGAFSETAALYAAIFILTSAGTFLFTRIFIPDALLSLLLALCVYLFQRTLEPTTDVSSQLSINVSSQPKSAHFADAVERPASRTTTAYAMWATLALATLTKGLIAPLFLVATAITYLAITHSLHRWRDLKPFTGILLFLAIAAPWHILAGLRNTDAANGHGFFWFYFVNEHLLRFLGHRIPRDYNRLPFALYWSLHLIWLFPWSLFAPAAILTAWHRRRSLLLPTPAAQTVLLLGLFSTLVLCFFSLSTNQEYYTFPVYLPLLMLIAAALAQTQRGSALTAAFATYTALGILIAAALTYGLWSARALPFNPDIGSALAHRGVGDYTLSMSHFFDLTGPSFAALRLPATLAAIAFLIGPGLAWWMYSRRRQLAAILTIAATSAIFFIAAHIALLRFAPMLSSGSFAQTIKSLEATHRIEPGTQIFLFGDQAYGSSIPFYLHRSVYLVDGRSTSMLFGSTFPDAPPIFLTHQQLLAQWGSGPRKILFVPLELRDQVDQLLGPHKFLLLETSGKALYTDRPLTTSNENSKP